MSVDLTDSSQTQTPQGSAMALQLLGFGNCITCQSAELDRGEPAPALGASGKALVPGCRVYSCSTCRSHTAEHNDIISKARFAPFPAPSFLPTCRFNSAPTLSLRSAGLSGPPRPSLSLLQSVRSTDAPR